MVGPGEASERQDAPDQERSGLALGATHRATLALLVGMALYFCFHRFALSEARGMYGLHDVGWVSWFTMALQGVSLVLILAQIRRAASARGRAALVALAYIALIYLLREADFHRLFTDEHVTRGRFYLDATIPIMQRLIAAMVMLPFFACALAMVVRYCFPILRALRAGVPWAVSLTLWGVALVGSQVADQTMSGYMGKLIEEGLEATASGLALLTVLHARARPTDVLDYTDRSRSR
jgi:hypothetical protein